MESKFLISVNYSFSVIKKAANKDSITIGVNIYLYGYVSLLAPVCAVHLCVCVCVCGTGKGALDKILKREIGKKFLSSKEHLDWLKIGFNVAEIITV